MMKTDTNKLRKEVRTVITTALSGVTSNVYYLNFPKPATYPYVVFELRELSTNDGRTSYTLEVDAVSQSANTTNSMADVIGDAFDHNEKSTNDLFFHAYRARRYAVVEEDKSIQRVHLQMDLFYYSKEEYVND